LCCFTTTLQGANSREPFPELEACVVTLSAGPVASADGIGYANAALVKRSCAGDGRLLQPSRPAMLIDRCFRARAHAAAIGHNGSGGSDDGAGDDGGGGGGGGGPAVGEVWTAASFAAGATSYHAFASNLTAPFSLVPSDVVGWGPDDAARDWVR